MTGNRLVAFLAITTSTLNMAAQAESVVINEIHYHPSNAMVLPGENAEDLQYIELFNAGTGMVDLAGWHLSDGVQCTIPGGTQLNAGEYLLTAANPVFLRAKIPTIPTSVQIVAWTAGADLPNGGGIVRLVDGGSVEVDSVTYDDAPPWPTAADGFGPSLELVNPKYDNSSGTVWRDSAVTNGSPGTVNGAFADNPIVFTEVPVRTSIIATLPQVSVTFAEPVRNVAASNLTVNSSLATSVACAPCSGGVGAGPYVFSGFAAPTTSPINVALAPGTIEDLAGHGFAGDNWVYSFQTPAVVINEIHYHPLDAHPNAEFIELYNAEAEPVDISGWKLYEFASPGYTFPANTVLQPGGFIVVAKDPAVLLAVTGFSTPHSWGANDGLNNSSEPIRLDNALGIMVDRVVYDDDAPWPLTPDGHGPSLELVNPAFDNAQGNAWHASLGDDGTPGEPNSVWSNAPRLISEVPQRGSAVESLSQITLVFNTPVTGVDAGDLSVAGSLATSVVPATGPADSYTFSGFPAPPNGAVAITLAGGGIEDGSGHPFQGDSWTVSVGQLIVFNELHYHPADPNGTAEFIEFYNAGSSTVDMSGWFMTDGVDLTFPQGTSVGPGQYLVISGDPALLASLGIYSGAIPWVGDTRLSNGGERVAISDAAGNLIDAVEYADGGQWPAAGDGQGPSIELINPRLPNQYGSAWKASTGNYGTPGALNSRYQAAPPPIISGAIHDPPIPAPAQNVRITATVIDDQPDPTVTLYYRQDQDPTIAYTPMPMFDDGFHGDGAAGDDVYGAIVPGLADGQRLDFTIRATDGTSTTAAPPGHDTLNAGEYPAQTYLCKFQSPPYHDTEFPTYHMVTTQRTRNVQENHSLPSWLAESPYDATFIRCTTTGQCEIFYNVLEHYRGASSLWAHPHSFHIDFNDDQPLQSEMGFKLTRLLLMSQVMVKSYLGHKFFREAFDGAILAPRTQFVRLNTSPLSGGGVQDFIYINIERMDDDFLQSQGGDLTPLCFPDRCNNTEAVCTSDTDCPGGACVPTDSGNLYRGRHDDRARLYWRGYNPNDYVPNQQDGNNGYEVINNQDSHDWTDLMTLCWALDPSTTPDSVYEQSIEAVVDYVQWARWFGIHNLLVNQEGGLYRDTGDDYYLYFPGPSTAAQFPLEIGNVARLGHYQARMLSWDMDSIWGGNNTNTQETIWRTTVANVARLLRSNEFAGLFVDALCDMLENDFTTEKWYPLIDAIPDSLMAQETPRWGHTKQMFKDWIVARRNYINSEIKRQVTISGVPASPYTNSNPLLSLSGQLDQRNTRWVKVNGQPVDAFSVFGATWSKQFTLSRGTNYIVVQCLDRNGQEVNRATATVHYDPPPASIRLTMPTRMVNTKTLTLKGELLDTLGNIDWRIWHHLGTVSATRVANGQAVPLTVTVFERHTTGAGAGGPPTTDALRFYNGIGSVSFTLNDGSAVPAGDLLVTITVDGVSASKVVTVLDAATPGLFQDLAGTLSGDNLTWEPADGVIHLTGNVTVPSGQVLTILPGTLIMVDPGPDQNGTKIIASGSTIHAQGTQANPVYFFPTSGAAAMVLPQTGSEGSANGHNNPSAWGGFELSGSGNTTWSYVFMTGTGNGVVEGHPRPAVIRLNDSHAFTAVDCVLADSPGKVFYGNGSGVYTFQRCLFARNGIGAECLGTGYTLTIEDSWFTRIGRAPVNADNRLDGDILHIDRPSDAIIRRSILTDGGDDMIDHSTGATVVVENSIIYDGNDKVVSIGGGGTITLTNCLAFNVPNGVRCAGVPAYLTHTTLGPNTNVNGQSNSSIMQKCILWTNSADTCWGDVDYTLVGTAGNPFCGIGNLSTNPLFLDSIFSPPGDLAVDFNLQYGSPALSAGPTGGRIGWLGFPTSDSCLTNADCDDGNPCTTDTCSNEICVHAPITGCCIAHSDCDDHLYCNGVETCGGDNQCDAGTPVNCGAQYCDESRDACVQCLTPAHCSDNNACNGTETCQAGVCVGGTPPNCDDGNACTDDACIPASGCVHTNNANACDDGIVCTSPDVCAGGACVGTDNCSPGQTCNHTSGACEFGPQTATFQQGDVHGYTGTVDTYIDAALGSQALVTPIVVDGSPVEHVLLRFDGIFGAGTNQIPPGSTIVSATLTLRVGDVSNDQSTNAVNFHRLLHGWDAADVWAAYGVSPWNASGGIQNDEVDAVSTADATATMSTANTAYSVDVKTSLQAWAAEAGSNFGWVILPTGSDGLRLVSAEGTTAAYRPLLTVEYIAGCEGPSECDDGNPCTTNDCVSGGCVYTPIPGCCVAATDCDDSDACTTDTCDQGTCSHAMISCDDGITCTTDTCLSASGCQHADNCTGGQFCNLGTGQCETPTADPLPIVYGDIWKYFKGLSEPSPGDLTAWTHIDFDDSAWLDGPTGLGYDYYVETGSTNGNGDYGPFIGTELGDMRNCSPTNPPLCNAPGYVSVYMRKAFTVTNAAAVTSLTFKMYADDGYVAYLNGTEVARLRLAGTPPLYNTLASGGPSVAPPVEQTLDLTSFKGLLVTGVNVLAVQGHNVTLDSRDVLLSPQLSSTQGCTTDAECDDNVFCNGAETCQGGACLAGTPPSCNDGFACTADSCNQTADACDHIPSDLPCDDGLWCNGAETCDPLNGCQAGTGPCQPDEACDETAGVCVGPPSAVAVGARYLAVTPPAGLASVALRVEAQDFVCLPRYVDADGRLVNEPVFQSSAAWGTVYVADKEVIPFTLYDVRADVRGPTDPVNLTGAVSASTWAWGDTQHDGLVNVFDIVCVLDGFQGIHTACSLQADDLRGDVPSGTVDIFDIVAVLDAFQAWPYPDSFPCAASRATGQSAASGVIRLVPSPAVIRPGDTVSIDVLANNAVDVRAYQVAVETIGGQRGSLLLDGARVDTARSDYVFAAVPSYSVVDAANARLAGARLEGGTNWAGDAYLGTLLFRASPDAYGTFRVVLRMTDTALLDSAGLPGAAEAGGHAVITVRIRKPVLESPVPEEAPTPQELHPVGS